MSHLLLLVQSQIWYKGLRTNSRSYYLRHFEDLGLFFPETRDTGKTPYYPAQKGYSLKQTGCRVQYSDETLCLALGQWPLHSPSLIQSPWVNFLFSSWRLFQESLSVDTSRNSTSPPRYWASDMSSLEFPSSYSSPSSNPKSLNRTQHGNTYPTYFLFPNRV